MLGQSGRLSIAIGLLITLISLGWTGWSYTAEERLTSKEAATAGDANESIFGSERGNHAPKRKVTGVVTGEISLSGDESGYATAPESQDEDEDVYTKPCLSNSWRLNAILVVVTCWTSVILTRWGDISTGGSVANPSVGQVAMWMIMASQWIALLLYSWTLAAPRLFPDRDFS
jgi:hypothetical protein